MNKRDAKAVNKAAGSSGTDYPYPMRSSRWNPPITRQELNIFYSQYKGFIDAADKYHQNILGYSKPQPEPPKVQR